MHCAAEASTEISSLIHAQSLARGVGRGVQHFPWHKETVGAPGLVPDAGLVQRAAVVPF